MMVREDILQTEVPLYERAKLEEFEKRISKLEKTRENFESMSLSTKADISAFKASINQLFNSYQHQLTELSYDIIMLFQDNPNSKYWFKHLLPKRPHKKTVFAEYTPWGLTTTDWMRRDKNLIPMLAKYMIFSAFLIENFWMAFEKMNNKLEVGRDETLSATKKAAKKHIEENTPYKRLAREFSITQGAIRSEVSKIRKQEQPMAVKP